MRRPRFA